MAASSPMARPSGNRPAPVWWELVEESLDEADALWRRRERALVAPDYTLGEVERLVEERLLGDVDGLQVAGDAAIERVLAPALASGEEGRVAVAAHVLAGGGDAAWERLGAALSDADDTVPALARGVELVWQADVLARLSRATEGAPAAVQAAVVDVFAFRRRDPGPGAWAAFAGADPRLAEALQRAARFAPPHLAEPVVHAGLAQPPPVRDAAIESGMVLGLPAARSACAGALGRPDDVSAPLLVLAALAGAGGAEHRALLAALGDGALAPAAVWALGFAGTRDAADACLDLLRQGQHERLASEAFVAITGVDLDAQGLRAAEPAAAPPGPVPFEEDDLDADLAADADPVLPRADAAAVARWWDANRGRFTPALRHVQGRPVDPEALARALSTAPMRRRAVLALDLAILTRGATHLNPRAFCREQRTQLRPAARARATPAGARPPPARAARAARG